MKIEYFDVNDIHIDHDFNCRGHINQSECISLAASIKNHGLQQPIVIRPRGMFEQDSQLPEGCKYVCVEGHRRLTAFRLNGEATIPAILKENLTWFQYKELNAIENLQRKDLTLFQQARSIKHYVDYGTKVHQIAAAINKSPSWVNLRIYVLSFPERIQELCDKDLIKSADVPALYKLRDEPVKQGKLAGVISDKHRKGMKNVSQMLPKPKDKHTTIKVRSKNESRQLQDVIQRMLQKRDGRQNIDLEDVITLQGNCLATRVIAWINGDINTGQMNGHLETMANICGVDPVFLETE